MELHQFNTEEIFIPDEYSYVPEDTWTSSDHGLYTRQVETCSILAVDIPTEDSVFLGHFSIPIPHSSSFYGMIGSLAQIEDLDGASAWISGTSLCSFPGEYEGNATNKDLSALKENYRILNQEIIPATRKLLVNQLIYLGFAEHNIETRWLDKNQALDTVSIAKNGLSKFCIVEL